MALDLESLAARQALGLIAFEEGFSKSEANGLGLRGGRLFTHESRQNAGSSVLARRGGQDNEGRSRNYELSSALLPRALTTEKSPRRPARLRSRSGARSAANEVCRSSVSFSVGSEWHRRTKIEAAFLRALAAGNRCQSAWQSLPAPGNRCQRLAIVARAGGQPAAVGLVASRRGPQEAVTALAMEESNGCGVLLVQEEFFQRYSNRCIQKPFDLTELRSLVRPRRRSRASRIKA